MKRVVSTILLVTLLTSMLYSAFKIMPAEAAGTIYIRADGSIDPPTAPIQRDGDVYTLTGDIVCEADGIVVERDNIVVDGAGYTLQGPESGTGIDLSGRSNVTIKNTTIKNNEYGIMLYSSSDNSISGNNITNNVYGIYLAYSSSNVISGNNISANIHHAIELLSSSNNSIAGNTIINSSRGIYLLSSSNYNSISGNNITNNMFGVSLQSSNYNSVSGNTFTNDGLHVLGSYQNSVENNTVNGRPLVYLEGVSNYTVDDAGQVILVRCDNIRVEGLNLSRATVGVELWETINSTISGNNITNNAYGIILDSSSNYNSVSGNNITNNDYGICLYSSSKNTVSGNNITNNGFGIELYNSSNYNSISGNNLTNSSRGIFLVYSSGNIISGNNIKNNEEGIWLWSSLGNSISHNNFINNIYSQVSNDNFVNVWDDGYPSGGNYWSDLNPPDVFSGPSQNETGSDKIGDTPYIIDANNTDNYPLIYPYGYIPSPDFNNDGIIDIFDIVRMALAYGSVPGMPNWDPYVDLNQDGIIDIFDLVVVALRFGETV